MFETLQSILNRLNPEALFNLDFKIGGYDARYIIYLAVFIGILIAFEGVRQLLTRNENREEAVNRRMRMIAAGKSGEDVLNLLKPKPKKTFLKSFPIVGNLEQAMRIAGLTMPPSLFLTGCAVAFVVAAVGGSQMAEPLMAVGISAFVFLLMPLAILRHVMDKHKEKLVHQLPDALDLMARGLKIGHPLNTTLQSVAREMPDPIGTEFGLIVDQITFGDELTTAATEMADRVDEEDLRYWAIAINMQHGSGGDLGKVLRTLSRVIRTRITLRRKVKAITSEGRLTAYILSGLPVAIAVMMSITSPTYYGGVMDSPKFWPTMAAIATAVVLNAVVLLRLVNFRV